MERNVTRRDGHSCHRWRGCGPREKKNGQGWGGMGRDVIGWDGMGRDGMGWDMMGWGWDRMGWDTPHFHIGAVSI